MNFLNRAIKNISRLKTKSILLIFTFLLIGNLVIVGLGISYASENAKTLTRQKMKPVVTFEVDYEAFQDWIEDLTPEEQEDAWNEYPQLTKTDFEKIIENEHIEIINLLLKYEVYADSYSPIIKETEGDDDIIVYREASSDYVYVERNTRLIGNAYDNMIELNDGTYVINEGRFYTQDEIDANAKVAVIEERLAAANNLKIGDYITVDIIGENSYESEYIGDLDTKIEYEIIGIYTNNTVFSEQDSWMAQQPAYAPENAILVPASSISEKLVEINTAAWNYYKEMWPDEPYYQDDANMPTVDNFYSNYVILLDDPLNVEEFVAESQDILPRFTKLNANDELFKKFAKPLDTMSLFASIIVWIVVINAVVIITLVTALTMKTREHEIGILLSMGVSKFKVVSQLFIELAVVAIIGFSLAVLSGSLMAKGIGQAVLDYQLANTEIEDDDNYYYYDDSYFTEITQDDMMSEYEVKINPLIIAEIYVMGMGVVLVSILIPSYMIMRFNPKRILTNTY
ncbi:MAG: ABC transporter permease [Erysipelotrichaceae bacterium]|nr:ABC transporter permease [Erysipelotrichaceae bacterium]MDD4642420.1 ABC transporter permease [Erysipelotrichaceae bacterium]